VIRSCKELPIKEYLDELGITNSRNISLFVDTECADEIIKFLEKNRKKFLRIFYVILSGFYNEDLYGKEDVGSGTQNIAAMKFKGKNFGNSRIYCKEFFYRGKQVVMVTMLQKKVQKIKDDKLLKQRLEIIGGYEYEFK